MFREYFENVDLPWILPVSRTVFGMSKLSQRIVANLAYEFLQFGAPVACEEAKKIANVIKDILLDADQGILDVSQEENIGLEDDPGDPNWDSSEDEDDDDQTVMSPSNPKKRRFSDQEVDVESVEEAVGFYRSPAKGHRSLSCMKSRFRWIRTDEHLKQLRAFEAEGIRKKKRSLALAEIKEKLLEWTLEKMKDGTSLHDTHLQYQALAISREIGFAGFKASKSFITRFKEVNWIRSRKITKFVVKKNFKNQSTITEAGEKFVKEVKDFIVAKNIPPTGVYNADQSGFVKEMHGARSLAIMGQKSVFRIVDSVSATTHPFTVLPMISPSGAHRDKLCIVLQEPGGKLPAKGHAPVDNLVVFAHTSHIMTKALMIRWLKECVFMPSMPNPMLLVLDSLGPFKDHAEIQKHVPRGKRVYIKNIPPGCTGKVQPLDVFYFNPFKRFMKMITSFVQVQGIDFPVHRRDNLLKAVSLVFWQFSHPMFEDFVKYSWSAAGYTGRPIPFKTPVQYCFDLMQHSPLLHPLRLLWQVSVFRGFRCSVSP